MKFPSLKYLYTQAIATLLRFYLPLLFSFTGTVMALYLSEKSNPTYFRILLSCSIGLSLSIGCFLFAERSQKRIYKFLFPVIILLLIVAYWYWLTPDDFGEFRKSLVFFILSIILHLWVSISCYLKKYEKIAFWQFNEALFIRMLLSGIFTIALYAGLALAIYACEELLKLKFDRYIYLKLWILIVGVFNTWFFLSGIPLNFAELNTEKEYPKFLKIFSQYILIPIVFIYMLILYAYGSKIVIEWCLPKGWVSILILIYAVVGILAILLVNPLREKEEYGWVRFFNKLFFGASLPIIVLLYTAIFVRVKSYGITESRYYLIVLGIWLGFISIYFLVSKQKNIRTIPFSLVIIGLLTLFGPSNVFSIANNSQLSRLKKILISNKIWKPGEKLEKSSIRINNHFEAEQVKEIIDYFVNRKEPETLQPIFAIDIKKLHESLLKKYKTEDLNDWEIRNELKDTLIRIVCTNEKNGMTRYRQDISFNADISKGSDISGYTKLFYFDYYRHNTNNEQWVFLSPTDSIQVILTEKDTLISLDFYRNKTIVEKVILNDFIAKLKNKQNTNNIPLSEMTIDGTGELKPRLVVKIMNIKHPESFDDGMVVRDLYGWILLK